jgi:S-formylglutathione hydrolase FrmB
MNRVFLLVVCFLAIGAAIMMVGCSQRSNPAIPETPEGGAVVQGVHQYNGLLLLNDPERSAFSGRWVAAYLPKGYKFDIVGPRFPVLYLLPGYDGEPSFYYRFGNENYYQIANVAEVADRLIASGEIKPVIIIMPDASIPYGGSFYANSSLEGPWEDMMAEELIHYVDTTYLTLGDEYGKESRAISGNSSGGYGAVRLAMDYPDLFNSVSAIDAPLAFEGSGPFTGVQELFGDYLTESGITSEAGYQATDTTGFRNQPFKMLFYSMAATFSPSVATTTNFGKLRISLPFDYQGNLVDTVWSKWLANDLYSWLDDSQYQTALSGQHLYFESSDQTLNLFNQQTLLFEQKLNSLGITYESAMFEGYSGYEHRSRSFLYDRIEHILKFHDRYLRDRFGNF